MVNRVGTFGFPFMYTGEMVDANALVYLRARYYHPDLGVFMGLDPVEGVNRYQYVSGNVTNIVDPSGMIYESPGMWDPCEQVEDDPKSPQLSLTPEERERILESSVVITVGPYTMGCSKEKDVVCGSKQCEGMGLHQGLGTLIDHAGTSIIISHDHYASTENRPNTSSQSINSLKNDPRIDWIEFRGAQGTIHIPIDKLDPLLPDFPTAIFGIGGCDATAIGSPIRLKPYSDEGSEAYKGNLIYNVYVEGPNVTEPDYSLGFEHFWDQLGVREAEVDHFQPTYTLVAILKPGFEPVFSGDSGGGGFMKIDGELYFIGPLQGISPGKHNSQELWFHALQQGRRR